MHGIKRFTLSEEARKLKLEKDKAKIDGYRNLTSKVLQLRDEGVYTIETLNRTTDIIQANPEFYTVWNYRREILLKLFERDQADMKTLLEDDLKLVMIQLRRFPKCYWIWNHRTWCLSQLQEINRANWQYELAIVSKLLELDSRNFHGWQYRRYVVENMEKKALKESEIKKDSDEEKSIAQLKIALDEFKYTSSKINKNISNFSAWHNRSKLIPKVYFLLKHISNKTGFEDESRLFSTPYEILKHELELTKTGMYMDVDDTSIWFYLYWLLTEPLFVNDLRDTSNDREVTYLQVLRSQLQIIEELNEIEKSDHIDNWDNCWCLKSMVMIKSLINIEEADGKVSCIDIISDEIKEYLAKLVEIDPLRRGKYIDQMHGKASTVTY